MDMQEIELGLLNSQFGIFIKVWIRHLGVMRLLDVGLAGPLLISVKARVANCRQSCSLWLVEGANFASGSVAGVTPRVISITITFTPPRSSHEYLERMTPNENCRPIRTFTTITIMSHIQAGRPPPTRNDQHCAALNSCALPDVFRT